jgi:small subunit ribosomal protein S5
MAEDNKQEENNNSNDQAAQAVAQSVYGDKQKRQRGGRPPRRDSRGREEKRDEFEQRILEVARVTRVMAGGKRMNFRACVAIGDRKNGVAVGLGKGADVTMAVNKAVNRAKKTIVKVPVVNDTIPHAISHKLGAAIIVFKPAKKGKGVMAGGVVRAILELAGIKNVSSKILGTNSKINNARCTIEALANLRTSEKKNVSAKKVKDVKDDMNVHQDGEIKTETDSKK